MKLLPKLKTYLQSLLLVTGLIATTAAFGQPPENCQCLWQGSFSKVASRADLIISGQVLSSKGNSADIAIDRVLYDRGLNNKEFSPVVRIWGDNGKLCRPPISEFPPQTEWLLALHKITDDVEGGFNPHTPNISYGRINDYYLSQCGAYWLQLTEGMVSGNLVKGRRWEWQQETMNPVLLELVDAYIKDIIPEQALVEAAKPLTEAKKLLNETKSFIYQQQD
jgi:hypothetical protein